MVAAKTKMTVLTIGFDIGNMSSAEYENIKETPRKKHTDMHGKQQPVQYLTCTARLRIKYTMVTCWSHS